MKNYLYTIFIARTLLACKSNTKINSSGQGNYHQLIFQSQTKFNSVV
ncbi:hypothetical protein [Mucilaginibacter sp. UR6-11]|nr:hypothetical protein [Mucilaginibacter sp. UR6-11]MCC8424232.1 hypothetical protein [Mucilaginibacter sp. UR6-11]